MSDRKISFMIGCGWFAAAISAILSMKYGGGGQALLYTSVAANFLLAIGIFLRIDWCAVITLLVYVGLRFKSYEVAVAMQQRAGKGYYITEGFWITAILFTQLYVLSVIGTLLHNRRHPEIRYSLASLLWKRPGEAGLGLERRSQ